MIKKRRTRKNKTDPSAGYIKYICDLYGDYYSDIVEDSINKKQLSERGKKR